jgi:hypothetical protein
VEPDALYPVHADVPWAREEGRVVVLLPKRLGPFARAVRRLARGPAHVRVQLDDVGSRAFELSDGLRTMAQVADRLVDELAERAGPRDRALAFLGTLARNGVLLLATEPVVAPRDAPPPRRLACPRCGRGFHTADPEGTRLRCPACRRPVRA